MPVGKLEFRRRTIETGNRAVTKCLSRVEGSACWRRVEGPSAKEGDVVVINSLGTETHTIVEKLPSKD